MDFGIMWKAVGSSLGANPPDMFRRTAAAAAGASVHSRLTAVLDFVGRSGGEPWLGGDALLGLSLLVGAPSLHGRAADLICEGKHSSCHPSANGLIEPYCLRVSPSVSL